LPENADRRAKIRADPRHSQGLEFGAALLECFTAERPALGIAEMADTVGLSRSTVHRYAITLLALGYLEQDAKRRYRLSLRAGVPGASAIGALRAEIPAAATILEDLREQTGHTVSMAALDANRALYIHRFHTHNAGQHEADLNLRVGAHIPLHNTAIGKALLASLSEPEQRQLLATLTLTQTGPNTIANKKALQEELARIRVNGIATCDEEQAPGIRSIAVAITHPGRSHPLAIGITVPACRYTPKRLISRFRTDITAAAQRI
jgi:IclR family pca regulon transcriptional regulator